MATNTLVLQHETGSDTYHVYRSPADEDEDIAVKFLHRPDSGSHGEALPLENAPRMWQPFWVGRPALIGFLLLYAALFVGLLLVRYFSDKYNGFFVAESTSHYTWTYGPTAVLVLVASFWHQVDYHCKILSPWSQMYKGTAPAAKTILLDLVSPLTLVAAIQAARLRNLPVLATLAGYGLLKLIVSIKSCFRLS